MSDKKKILILGGTGESVALCDSILEKYENELEILFMLALGQEGLDVYTPARQAGVAILYEEYNSPEEFSQMLKERKITAVINGMHPFAEDASIFSKEGSDLSSTPFIRLIREEWEDEEDIWHNSTDILSASAIIPHLGSRILLSIGVEGFEMLAHLSGCQFVVCSEFPILHSLPLLNYKFIVDDINDINVEKEKQLLQDNNIEVLVARNTGSSRMASKVIAAQELGVAIIMINRPPNPEQDTAVNLQQVYEWLGYIVE